MRTATPKLVSSTLGYLIAPALLGGWMGNSLDWATNLAPETFFLIAVQWYIFKPDQTLKLQEEFS